jgi:hypothetical protein
MEKYINDLGEVGVLVSEGYGSGWSTWNDIRYSNYLCMDKTLVEMKLKGASTEEVEKHILKTIDGYVSMSGWENTEVNWVEQGTAFTLTVRDGDESLEYIMINCMVA